MLLVLKYSAIVVLSTKAWFLWQQGGVTHDIENLVNELILLVLKADTDIKDA